MYNIKNKVIIIQYCSCGRVKKYTYLERQDKRIGELHFY